MEYSSAFCSAGWLWRQQSLCFELGIWCQPGWCCKASTLGKASKVSRKPMWPPATWDSCGLFHLTPMTTGVTVYCGCTERLTTSYTSQCVFSDGGHQHPGGGWEAANTQQLREDVLSSGWTATQWTSCRFLMSVFGCEKTLLLFLIDMVHKIWKVFSYRGYSLKQPLEYW